MNKTVREMFSGTKKLQKSLNDLIAIIIISYTSMSRSNLDSLISKFLLDHLIDQLNSMLQSVVPSQTHNADIDDKEHNEYDDRWGEGRLNTVHTLGIWCNKIQTTQIKTIVR